MLLSFAEYVLAAALAFVVIALVCNLVALTARKRAVVRPAQVPVAVGVGAAADGGVDAEPETDPAPASAPAPAPAPSGARPGRGIAGFAATMEAMGLVMLTAYLVIRMSVTGHGPFANQHEFAVSFCWGILAAWLVVLWRFRIRVLSLVVLPVVAVLLVYAMRLDAGVEPLVPALQNNLLLSLHVGFAILSYGAACVSFAAAVMYLIYPRLRLKTPRDRFDELGYKAAMVAFPLMTIMIALGALWAETAWGAYWSWDPKETAALVTWLLYAGFLHARVARGWRGSRAAWLLVIGFAAVMFAYFGNHFLGGLHSYA